MDRLRTGRLAPLALAPLALAALAVPAARTQEPLAAAISAEERTCVTYSLAELGNDPDLGRWVAETIPEVIAPGSWKEKGVLRYYGPKNLLVIYHTPATQEKVAAFLMSVKRSLPPAHDRARVTAQAPAQEAAVVPADFRLTGRVRGSGSFAEQSPSYPVPAPAARPKHLFHFIIRYEGEGIVDDNVVKAIKSQVPGKTGEKASRACCTVPAPAGSYTQRPADVREGSLLSPSETVPSVAGTGPPSSSPALAPSTSEKKDKEDRKIDPKESR